MTTVPSRGQREEKSDAALAPSPPPTRAEYWADVDAASWDDWHWQLANRLDTAEKLEQVVRLSDEERRAIVRVADVFPLGITPYYASLIDADDPACPIRRQCVPRLEELERRFDELHDPLAEERDMRAPGLTHRYPDRVLLYSTHVCAVYCRFCNRRRKVGSASSAPSRDDLAKAIDYIRRTPQVRDVLVSGGDPLSYSDARLDELLGELRSVPHVEIIRVATRNPATLPQRVTPALVDVLRKHHPIYVNTHFNHPRECTPEAERALTRLADGGCVVGNQMVLLKGVNDDAGLVRRMNRWLLARRCRPYYIFQCDPAEGVSHFRTSVETGVRIIGGLRGWTSGLAVPHYVVDLPGGGGKVALEPTTLISRRGRTLTFRSWAGEIYNYEDGE